MIIGIIIGIILIVAEILIIIIDEIEADKKKKEILAKREALKTKIKEQEEIIKQEKEKNRKEKEHRDRKAEEHKEALAWCTKRCNEYKQEQHNKKLIEVLNKI